VDAESKFVIINILEGCVKALKENTFEFTEEHGQRLVRVMKDIIHPNQGIPADALSISVACDYLQISQPTFRKYVREGFIAEGYKIPGITNLVWDKSEIERFFKEHFSRKRKHANR
jgi:hypothetical protein